MFAFQLKKLSIRYEYVTAITEALGGAIRIADKKLYEEQDLIKTTRVDLPYAVARSFKKKNRGHAKFLIPIMMAIVTYDGMIVQVEKAIWDKNSEQFTCTSERSMSIIEAKVRTGNWFTDGIILYCVPDYSHDINHDHTYLTKSKRFFAVSVESLKFADMSSTTLIQLSHTRTIVGFITSNKEVVFSPPIWKNVMEMRSKGNSGLAISKDNVEAVETYRFDLLNDNFVVNLEFILTAGRNVGSTFGFDTIEFLRINEYMIDLCTVNLPNIPKSERSTYETGLQFINCFAWLLGFVPMCDNLRQYNSLRGVFKVLSMTGLFSRVQIEKSLNGELPQLKTAEQALEFATDGDQIFDNNVGRRTARIRNGDAKQILTGIVD